MRVFLSFLGLGSPVGGPPATDYVYSDAAYRFRGREWESTPYVQEALLLGLEANDLRPDLVLLAMTDMSEKHQWLPKGRLQSRLLPMGLTIREVRISEALDSPSQWATFEKLLGEVPVGAELYVDVTHGFRHMPILFSAAINFLSSVKGVRLGGVFYGAYEPRKDGPFEIVELTDFYRVNQWAEAVKTLVSTGDARTLVEVAAEAPNFQAGALRNEELAKSLQRLSLLIRNVDANKVPDAAREAIALVRRVKSEASESHVTARLLLDTLDEQFARLAQVEPLSGRYDEPYFRSQLALVDVLNSYGLLMQSFTVLRELIGSIGVTGYAKYRDKGRLLDGRKYSDLWVNMCQFDEAFKAQSDDQRAMAAKLTLLRDQLKGLGHWDGLVAHTKDVVAQRNAFDHARMNTKAAPGDDPALQSAAERLLTGIRTLVDDLVEAGIIPSASKPE